MLASWSRPEKIGFAALVVGIIGCIAALAVVPDIRAWLDLPEYSRRTSEGGSSAMVLSTLIREPTGRSPSVIDEQTLRDLCSTRLEKAQLMQLTPRQLEVLRNAIFALHGRQFARRDLREYFFAQPWYTPDPGYSEKRLTGIDFANVALIQEVERAQ